jgi:hypothetical protein
MPSPSRAADFVEAPGFRTSPRDTKTGARPHSEGPKWGRGRRFRPEGSIKGSIPASRSTMCNSIRKQKPRERGFSRASDGLEPSTPPYHRATSGEPGGKTGKPRARKPRKKRNRPKASDRSCMRVPGLVFPQCSLASTGDHCHVVVGGVCSAAKTAATSARVSQRSTGRDPVADAARRRPLKPGSVRSPRSSCAAPSGSPSSISPFMVISAGRRAPYLRWTCV